MFFHLSYGKATLTVKLLGFFGFFAQAGRVEETLHLEQKLYDGVTATSVWLDGVEEQVFVATALLPEEETETYVCKQEVRDP